MVVCGNKKDLDEYREVPVDEVIEYCSKIGSPFMETSAKTGLCVRDSFHAVMEQLMSTDEIVSPSEAKIKFQQIADSEFAERLQTDEFSALKGANVSSSQTRHQNVTVGSRVAAKVALQEETINKIVETERLKREEMDMTLANKLQDKETGDTTGVQTWLSRELIGFNHTKNRIQELRSDDQLAQQLQDEEMAAMLQEKEDKSLANHQEEVAKGELSSLKLARSLTKPVIDPNPYPLNRTGSGNLGRPPVSQELPPMSKSKTFSTKIESPVLKPRPHPMTAKKSNPSLQSVIREVPARETISMGSVPKVGHPFLQTAADQQLFKEREISINQLDANYRPEPPAYSCIDQSKAMSCASDTISCTSESDQSDSLLNITDIPELTPRDVPIPVPDQSELTPVPPPPFSGTSPSKLRNKKKK
ncbi:Ras-like protein rasD [Oopsacas minuta]|uniref:Ras-like protein rasD n=1 Tax=Oopsacas minuta TaxID=111878 RepID=A0AAV7KHT6_9METZ|nr:Ras-like protein rasD [Oopsacas minuta]